ncbi:unnamed protein product [Paramecium sonneborni]|uniref:Uncharacterized protein n=1 Tax=Paramecium sonneborni TaxID=65129 RepID=A0A8S1RQM6_9CILI|nr:unnamed protein product [Paramecium sonneborni]
MNCTKTKNYYTIAITARNKKIIKGRNSIEINETSNLESFLLIQTFKITKQQRNYNILKKVVLNKKTEVESLVKNKTYFNHRSLMNDYFKRQNISIATKVFFFNSQDKYIRRCLQRHSWLVTLLTNKFLI